MYMCVWLWQWYNELQKITNYEGEVSFNGKALFQWRNQTQTWSYYKPILPHKVGKIG